MKFNNYSRYLSDNNLVIFLFHGVIKSNHSLIRNYNNKHILESDFQILLKTLLETGTPVSMDDFLNYSNGKPMPSKPFIITFDDGFQNNLTVATPILKELAIPATFYITTDFIDRNSMSWIDRIDLAFEQTLKDKIKLPWQQNIRLFSSPKSKINLLEEIRNYVKNDSTINTIKLADNIQKQLNIKLTYSNNSALDTKLSWSELKTLSSLPNIIIGGHTHTHSIMSFLNHEDLNNEIDINLKLIKKHTGIVAHHYSYPEGLAHCYDKSVISLLKKKGI